jgi:hypothetical protein
MSTEQLRWANERVRELRPDFRVHMDARGWSVTAEMTFTFDGGATTTKTQATIVEPKRTAVEALEWCFEVFQEMKTGRVEQFYSDRAMRGLSLDIAPARTEAQRARFEQEQHARKIGMENFNNGLQRQLRYLLDRQGLTNISRIKKALR